MVSCIGSVFIATAVGSYVVGVTFVTDNKTGFRNLGVGEMAPWVKADNVSRRT